MPFLGAAFRYIGGATSKGATGFMRGVAGGALRGTALYGIGEGIQDLSQQTGPVGALAGTVAGFAFKAMGVRAGVGGVLSGTRMATSQWAGMTRANRMNLRGPGGPYSFVMGRPGPAESGGGGLNTTPTLRGLIAGGAARLESGYRSVAYEWPRQLMFGRRGGKGMGLVGGALKHAALFPVTAPFKMAKGMFDVGAAYLAGTADLFRKGGGRGFFSRAFEQPAKTNWINRKRPLWGMFGWGAAIAGPSMMTGNPRVPGHVGNGINPRNYGRGIVYEGARGMRRMVSLGSENVAQRMAGMR